MDSGSCYNIPHLKPYKLQWLNEDEDLTIDKQVKVSFSVGNYNDNVLCDIVSMEACHILLGRPWQFDKKTTHNGLSNEITFTHSKRFLLFPLTPSEVVEDQEQMKRKTNIENKISKIKGSP